MNKKFLFWEMVIILAFLITGCTNKELEAANQAVNDYNSEVMIYNDKAKSYNKLIDEIESANMSLDIEIESVQDVINKGEAPYDDETLNKLNSVLTNVKSLKVSVPDKIETIDKMTLNPDAKKDELEAITSKANEEKEKMSTFTFPDNPSVPDFTEDIKDLDNALTDYKNSITVMNQITAPSDQFVMERIKRIDSITLMDAVTEDHDPNGQLGKQGGYIGCIYFRDSQVDQSTLYVDGDPEDVIEVGTQGGGAIEIFNTAEEAHARDLYLANFDGTIFVSGSHYVIGSVLIRTSDKLTASQQTDLTDKIKESLISIE